MVVGDDVLCQDVFSGVRVTLTKKGIPVRIASSKLNGSPTAIDQEGLPGNERGRGRS